MEFESEHSNTLAQTNNISRRIFQSLFWGNEAKKKKKISQRDLNRRFSDAGINYQCCLAGAPTLLRLTANSKKSILWWYYMNAETATSSCLVVLKSPWCTYTERQIEALIKIIQLRKDVLTSRGWLNLSEDLIFGWRDIWVHHDLSYVPTGFT